MTLNLSSKQVETIQHNLAESLKVIHALTTENKALQTQITELNATLGGLVGALDDALFLNANGPCDLETLVCNAVDELPTQFLEDYRNKEAVIEAAKHWRENLSCVDAFKRLKCAVEALERREG